MVLVNPHRPDGIPGTRGDEVAQDPEPVLRLLHECPVAAPTPLLRADDLADGLSLHRLWVKDERARMGLGSFKALGAAYVIAAEAADSGRLEGVTYVAASAGNHGLSLATGAKVFGASAVVYISGTVPERFERRLREAGADVTRVGADYEECMAAAAEAAARHGWRLLSDSSWPGYTEIPRRVMEGYLVVGSEIADQLPGPPPTHVFLQAGVGGLAAATAGFVRSTWGEEPSVVVVEPETARPLMESIRAGRPVRADGPPSTMGRLDCKEPSHLALAALSRWADVFVTVDDAGAEEAARLLARHGIPTTPSGAAGFAAVAGAERLALGLSSASRVLVIVSETGWVDGESQDGIL